MANKFPVKTCFFFITQIYLNMFWYYEKNLLFGHPWDMKWPKEIALCQIDM